MPNRTFRGTTNSNWGTSTNWLELAVPTSADDVIFDSSSPNCTVNVVGACRSLNFSSYTNTITMTNAIGVTIGNITLGSGMTFSGSSGINYITTNIGATFTSNGKTFPNTLSFAITVSAPIHILADDWQVGNLSASQGVNLSGNTMRVSGNLIGAFYGTTQYIMNGSGVWSGTAQKLILSGNVTMASSCIIDTGSLKWATGTITPSASTLTLSNSCTADLSGKTINNLSHGFSLGAQTITYLSDVYCANFTIGNGTNTYNGPGKIYASGNYTIGGGNSGSLVVELKGTGTISTGLMGLVCIVNASGGTYTLGASLTIGNTFTYTSGNVNAATSTVTLSNGITLSSAGINWYNITVPTGTITLNNLMNVTNNLTLAATASVTFAGLGGWNCGNLLCSTAGRNIILQSLNSYNTSTLVNMVGSFASPITLSASSLTDKAVWTLPQAATQSMVYVNGTRIDSSLGQTIWSFGGILNNTINWNLGTKPRTVSFTFTS